MKRERLKSLSFFHILQSVNEKVMLGIIKRLFSKRYYPNGIYNLTKDIAKEDISRDFCRWRNKEDICLYCLILFRYKSYCNCPLCPNYMKDIPGGFYDIVEEYKNKKIIDSGFGL